MSHLSFPLHDAAAVNKAARSLALAEEHAVPFNTSDLAIVNNWRSSHDYPLNGIHMTMKGRAKKILGGKTPLTAQRIKRLDSILLKLQDRPQMKLSQMQDIGGCRVILPKLEHVVQLRRLYQSSPVVHEVLAPKDYIAEPVEDSGYRSLHLKFKFAGRGAWSSLWAGLKVEMQVRTLLQHQWATAVEAAGTLKVQAFKSRRGDPDWLRFFKLVSSEFARIEGTPLVLNTPESQKERIDEIKHLDSQHHILQTLGQYAALIPQINKRKNAYFYVMKLDPIGRTVVIYEFPKQEAAESALFLEKLELETERPAQVVRVSVPSLKALERAYPNYFLDTSQFLKEVAQLIGYDKPLVYAAR